MSRVGRDAKRKPSKKRRRKGKRKNSGERTGERRGEGERENGEDDVGKEEANQKRKYALARPEALRSIVSRAAFSSLNCNFI